MKELNACIPYVQTVAERTKLRADTLQLESQGVTGVNLFEALHEAGSLKTTISQRPHRILECGISAVRGTTLDSPLVADAAARLLQRDWSEDYSSRHSLQMLHVLTTDDNALMRSISNRVEHRSSGHLPALAANRHTPYDLMGEILGHSSFWWGALHNPSFQMRWKAHWNELEIGNGNLRMSETLATSPCVNSAFLTDLEKVGQFHWLEDICGSPYLSESLLMDMVHIYHASPFSEEGAGMYSLIARLNLIKDRATRLSALKFCVEVAERSYGHVPEHWSSSLMDQQLRFIHSNESFADLTRQYQWELLKESVASLTHLPDFLTACALHYEKSLKTVQGIQV